MTDNNQTKIKLLLDSLGVSQAQLINLIKHKCGVEIGKDRISKFVNGKSKGVTLNTVKLIAQALDTSIDDITD